MGERGDWGNWGDLLRSVVELCVEGAEAEGPDPAPLDPPALLDSAFAGMLSREEEALVGETCAALETIARRLAGPDRDPHRAQLADAATSIGSAGMIMRSEFLRSRGHQVPELLPGFVYLVTLPFVLEEDAMRLSQDVADLLGGTQRG